MADNVTITQGTGTSIAGDDISSVIHQRVKIEYGDDGSATDVSDTNPLPVDDAGGSLTVDNAHLTSLGGAVSGGEVQVDIVGSLPAGTAAIGKLAANSGIDIGDVDVTSTVLPTGAAAVATGTASISTTAQIVAASATRKKVIIKNPIDAADLLYVGASGVATTDGFPLLQGESITLETAAAVHGVAGSGTITVRYLTIT